MSTITGASAAARSATAYSRVLGLAAALKRWRAAYITWRTQQAAIAQLWSMSDRVLKDIGLTRYEISGAVKGEVTRERVFGRTF